MAINKKFIHFKRKSTFQRELEAGNILNTSIVFIADAKQIYLNGSYFSENTLFNLSDLLNEVSGDLTSTDTSNEAIVKLYKQLQEVDTNTNDLIKILMQEVSTLEGRIDNTDLILATELSRIDQEIDNSKNLVNITYSELKSLRDSSKLIPGMQYRITDYEFTTTNDRMMAKPSTFDIIVTADDDHTLNESARAVARENVAAIPESRDYAAWELKYTIDNVLWSISTEGWIYTELGTEFTFKGTIKIDGNEWKLWYNENFDPEFGEGETYGYCATLGDIVENRTSASLVDIDNKRIVYQDCISILRYNSGNSGGKGTILWLKDEYLNEAYYDHHNALIKTYKVTACEKAPDVVGMYVMSKTDGTTIDNSDIKWMPSFGAQCYKNKYGKYLKQETSRDKKICINVLYDNCISNTFGDNSYSNTFNTNCGYNTFGTNSYNNTFNKYCSNNTIGKYCVSITFGSRCTYNILGNNCGSTIFGVSCSENTFGGYCYNTTLGYECTSNIFAESCSDNTFGHGCGCNTFGVNCSNNIFGDTCGFNSFGNKCNSNLFKNNCNHNSFGNGCDSNTFGDNCSGNTFGNYCSSNSFENSCSSNSFRNNCESNTFKNDCNNNTFGNKCTKNIFGISCQYNLFGNNCYQNTFENNCSGITFENYCYSNSFGNGCSDNSFENNCYSNSFEYFGSHNSFGVNCYQNTFGNNCDRNSFGVNCYKNTFGNHFRYNTLDNDVQYIKIPTEKIYHTQILNGTKGTSSNKLTIAFTPETTYSQFAGFTSKGELKIWNPADLNVIAE